MKVALLIYGHMRTYTQCFPFLQAHLLDAVQPDVFLHTWDETETRTRTWHNRQGIPAALDRAKVESMYRPAAMAVETHPQVNKTRVTPNNNLSYDGQKFMLYSLQRACALKRQHEADSEFEYDVVIKLRPDIKLLCPLIVPKDTSSRLVYIAANHTDGGECRACDIINITTSRTMDVVSRVHDHFDKFYVNNVNDGKLIHSGFVDYILSMRLRVVFLDYWYRNSWTIVRGKK